MSKPVLALTVGLPMSGKSTQAKESGYPVVSPDEIRLALHGQRFVAEAEPMVWAIARVMVTALFGSGHHCVILDACSATKKRRDEWKDARWDRMFVVIDTPSETCRARAITDNREDILPVIDRMNAQFEAVSDDEWDEPTCVQVQDSSTFPKAENPHLPEEYTNRLASSPRD